jgi:hypothetical protein
VARAQQTPSTQLPEAQSLDPAQVFPSAFRQVPDALQVDSALQVSSSAFLTGEHVPSVPARVQLWHGWSHATSQQTPSTQNPVGHWAPTVQIPFDVAGPPSVCCAVASRVASWAARASGFATDES